MKLVLPHSHESLLDHCWPLLACPVLLLSPVLHRRMRDDEIRRAFVHDMALNHLPHLYHALRRIADHMGLEIEEPPPVQFLELNGHDRKR
jgi:hypothetical protein